MPSIDTPPAANSPFLGKNVLVTGGTGSFGNAFVRRCLAEDVRRVVVFSRDELKQAQMAQAIGDARVRYFVGDVRDAERLARAMRGVDYVVHAAAMKRIETCEENPEEAIRTNVLGTLNVAKAAIDAGVLRAVLLSTDKAPAAATLYGATKFAAERLWCGANVYAAGRPTRLSAVRYGNVLGSRGSVLDLWRAQLRAGELVTITDRRCSRFWMTIDQAVDLVLLALDTMRGGEVLVPKVPSAPVLLLASAVAEQPLAVNGYRETGLRSAERLHETLIANDEARRTFDCGDHYVIEPESRTWADDVPLPWGLPVPDGFSYTSDGNPEQYDAAALRGLVA